jgi:lipopolysaccharide heptosyltransferase II
VTGHPTSAVPAGGPTVGVGSEAVPVAPRGRSAVVDPTAWARARRILCVRLDQIGDVLMTGPAIRALRESAPDRRITLLTSPAGAAVAGLMPEVDEIIVYRSPWMKATTEPDVAEDRAMIVGLEAARFDAAAIFTVYTQSALPAAYLCRLAGIPRRLGHARENPYHLLTDWVPDPEPQEVVRHEVRRQLDLVAAVGSGTADERLHLRVIPSAEAVADEVLSQLPGGRPWAVVHPGASAPSRRYPWEHYAAAATELALRHGWQLVFSGSLEEADLVERIRARVPVPTQSLAGRLDLAGLAAVLRRAPLLISGNTGPVHVAAAVGTPVVDLYALTNPQHAPWGVSSVVLSHDVPCRNCYASVCPMGHHHCLTLVPPERVVEAAVRLHPAGGGGASSRLAPATSGGDQNTPR